MKKLDKKSITVWNLETLFFTAIYVAGATIIFYFLNDYNLIRKLYVIVTIVLVANCLLDICLNPYTYRNRIYNLTKDTLYIQESGLTVRETKHPTNRFSEYGVTTRNVTIPLRRIQHIDMEQSLMSRLFNLHQINIFTAGNFQTIAYLNKEEADKLKETIMSYIIEMGEKIND
ncbi:PH domain-containing protein [Priestia aryabhattai]